MHTIVTDHVPLNSKSLSENMHVRLGVLIIFTLEAGRGGEHKRKRSKTE